MIKLNTFNRLIEVLPAFNSIYPLFADINTDTITIAEPSRLLSGHKHRAAFNDELGGLGLATRDDGACTGFFVFLNTPNKHIFLFDYYLSGQELGFNTDFALGIFDENGLSGKLLELVPCSSYYMLVEMLVNKVYELIELKDVKQCPTTMKC